MFQATIVITTIVFTININASLITSQMFLTTARGRIVNNKYAWNNNRKWKQRRIKSKWWHYTNDNIEKNNNVKYDDIEPEMEFDMNINVRTFMMGFMIIKYNWIVIKTFRNTYKLIKQKVKEYNDACKKVVNILK